MTETGLRELYQQALAARGGGDRQRCPTPEAILALVRREGPEEERLATLDHVMACDACRREFDLLRSIEVAGEEAAGARPPARGRLPFSWRHTIPYALAASLLVAIGLGVRDRGRVPDGGEIARGGSEGVTLLAPAATGVAAGAPLVFAWRPDPGARRYLLEVLDADGRAVVSESTSDTTFTLRDASRLAPDRDYRWWVRAVGDGGARRASPVRPLRLRSR